MKGAQGLRPAIFLTDTSKIEDESSSADNIDVKHNKFIMLHNATYK